MKQKGFTLIELMVVIVMIMILGSVIMGVAGSNVNHISVGINGITKSRCIEGYKFVISQDGNMKQILDEFGKGVRCSNIKEMK